MPTPSPFLTSWTPNPLRLASFVAVNQSGGFRVSAFQAFVDGRYMTMNDEREREYGKNLDVVTGAVVKGLLFQEGSRNKVVGVEYWKEVDGVIDDRETHEVRTNLDGGEVVLSAGAVSSPHLLMCSGIGCGTADEKVSLPVGLNLQDHLQLRQVFKLAEGTTSLNPIANSMIGRMRIGIEYGLKQVSGEEEVVLAVMNSI